MIKASEVKALVQPANLDEVKVRSDKLIQRIEDLIVSSAKLGYSENTYNIGFELHDTKNLLTQREITVSVLSTLQSHGYNVDLLGTTLTIKW